jgi:flagellar basal-body rod protein FlgC
MDFINSFRISASGMAVQRARLEAVIDNITNVNTTRTPEGGPYRRKTVLIESRPLPGEFNSILKEELRVAQVTAIFEEEAFKRTFDPGHPDADQAGFVTLPDIDVMREMINMITVNRSYEAVAAAFDATKQMALKSLELGK